MHIFIGSGNTFKGAPHSIQLQPDNDAKGKRQDRVHVVIKLDFQKKNRSLIGIYWRAGSNANLVRSKKKRETKEEKKTKRGPRKIPTYNLTSNIFHT